MNRGFHIPEGATLEPIIDTDDRAIVLDLSAGSMVLGESLNKLPVERFSELLTQKLAASGTGFAYGRWGEKREVYSSDLFVSDDLSRHRDIHLGIDVFCKAGTPVRAPLNGRVRVIANNARELDYGPLLILEHQLGEIGFFTLYGHLSLASIAERSVGEIVSAGASIACVGSPPENGNWAPHLHFQLIHELLDLDADFPGVASEAEKAKWLSLSPLPAAFFPECDASALDGR